jgi:hypothetical protein
VVIDQPPAVATLTEYFRDLVGRLGSPTSSLPGITVPKF